MDQPRLQLLLRCHGNRAILAWLDFLLSLHCICSQGTAKSVGLSFTIDAGLTTESALFCLQTATYQLSIPETTFSRQFRLSGNSPVLKSKLYPGEMPLSQPLPSYSFLFPSSF